MVLTTSAVLMEDVSISKPSSRANAKRALRISAMGTVFLTVRRATSLMPGVYAGWLAHQARSQLTIPPASRSVLVDMLTPFKGVKACCSIIMRLFTELLLEEDGCQGVTCVGDDDRIFIDLKPQDTGFRCTCKIGFPHLNDANHFAVGMITLRHSSCIMMRYYSQRHRALCSVGGLVPRHR